MWCGVVVMIGVGIRWCSRLSLGLNLVLLDY